MYTHQNTHTAVKSGNEVDRPITSMLLIKKKSEFHVTADLV